MDFLDPESAQSDATTAPAYANVPAKDRTSRTSLGRAPLTASFTTAWEHPRVLLCMLATFMAMPLLLVGLGSAGTSKPRFEVQTAAASYRSSDGAGRAQATPVAERLAPTTTVAGADTSSTSSSPSSSAPETTAAQPSTTQTAESTAPPTTQWQPPATTAPAPAPVTAPPTTTPPVLPAAPTSSESGQASYYDHPGGCAHKTLPFGTVVHITASNGNTASCVVNDRGPFVAGRIIDVDTATFAQLASLSAGVITVTISW